LVFGVGVGNEQTQALCVICRNTRFFTVYLKRQKTAPKMAKNAK
jgi:hypothetical protein